MSKSSADLDLAAVDLTDPRTFLGEQVPQMWRRFRDEDPISWRPVAGSGFWSVTRHEHVLQVYRSDAFSSEGGTVLATMLAGGDAAAGRMLAVTDGDRHRELKAVLQRSFSPRVMAALDERLQARTDQLVGELVGAGEVDFAREVSDRLPMGTIGDLLDLPAADWPQLLRWNKSALSSDSADPGDLDARTARNNLLLYFSEVVARRRRQPGADVISSLLQAEVQGRPLCDEDVVLNCYSLIIGGDESSRMASIGTVKALADHPHQLAQLRAGAVGVEAAVEEALRWTTPAMHFGRTVRGSVILGGHRMAVGDAVIVWNSSANRDERVFDDPERFDLARPVRRHVALGHGAHFCVGAFLGRRQLAVLLTSLRQRVRQVELQEPPSPVYSNFLQGYSSLRVSLWG